MLLQTQERSPRGSSRILGRISLRVPSARGSCPVRDGWPSRPCFHVSGNWQVLASKACYPSNGRFIDAALRDCNFNWPSEKSVRTLASSFARMLLREAFSNSMHIALNGPLCAPLGFIYVSVQPPNLTTDFAQHASFAKS